MLKAEKKCKVSGEDGDDAEEEESQAGTKTRVNHVVDGPMSSSRSKDATARCRCAWVGLFGITGEATLSTFFSPYLSTLRDC